MKPGLSNVRDCKGLQGARSLSLHRKILRCGFHNLSRYDAHIFIRELAEQFDVDEMEVLAVPIRVVLRDKNRNPVIFEDKREEEAENRKVYAEIYR